MEKKVRSMLQAGWQSGLSILFPPVCACCRIDLEEDLESGLCPSCIQGLRYLTQPWCRCCGVELNGPPGEHNLCGGCLQKPPAFTVARSIVHYTPEVLMLLKSLKYQRSTASLKTFQWIAGECDLSIFEECDLFLPVPLHLARLQARGLNQSLLLLQALFGVRKRDIRPMVLRKTRNTPPQTTLDGIRRRKNLKNCYEITDTSAIMEAVVCLVDDVYTTGTTVAECAKELLRQGCREVRVLTLARARGERR